MNRLKRSFYERDTILVAKELLGKTFTTQLPHGKTSGIITETEAYCGVDDPACHVYKNKVTERTKLLFHKPGTVYVYQIYGMYFCFNLIAHKKGKAGGVLLRAIAPFEGIEIMKQRRALQTSRRASKTTKHLADGPSKLCIALGIDKSLNGTDTCLGSSKIVVSGSEAIPARKIGSAPRINIDYAGKAKHYPWRFFILP